MKKSWKKNSLFFCPLSGLQGGGQSLEDMSPKKSRFLLTPSLKGRMSFEKKISQLRFRNLEFSWDYFFSSPYAWNQQVGNRIKHLNVSNDDLFICPEMSYVFYASEKIRLMKNLFLSLNFPFRPNSRLGGGESVTETAISIDVLPLS